MIGAALMILPCALDAVPLMLEQPASKTVFHQFHRAPAALLDKQG